MKYWFKPARFWKWFACYYPSSWQGWGITLFLGAILVGVFLKIDQQSHSGSDTLIRFAPWFIAIGLLFDVLCFRTGLYPSWWKRHGAGKGGCACKHNYNT